MTCEHAKHETCLRGDECAECLREEATRWREYAERLRPFAISYSSHPKRNPEDKLSEILAQFDVLAKRRLTE